MTLQPGVAAAVVGFVAVLIAAWGSWFSVGSSRRGPQWAYDQLDGWRPLPWALAITGLGLLVAVQPRWLGFALLYIAIVTGWLTRTVRINLARVRAEEGDLGDVAPPAAIGRTAVYLLAGAGLLGAVGIWDVWVRGWQGWFGLVLAACLGAAGWALRKAR